MMFLRMLPLAAGILAVLWVSAGRVNMPMFWAYTGVLWLIPGTIYTVLLHRSPALLAERIHPPNDRDKATRRIALPMVLSHYVLSGVDVGRWRWSEVPPAAQGTAFVLVALSLALVGWTLLSNPYASSAVRIQGERDHKVMTGGPYAYVRHPMYLAVLIFACSSGPALGSWWSSLTLLPLLAVFVRRTLMEDKMLHTELRGYADYATKVRWRVIPGIF
jgi:protein-S-isoprenylcysteine O-methyltransferase Ste14